MNVTLTDEEMIRHYLPVKPNQLFETLYNRYVNKVYKRCLYMTKDSEKAQDFTHDIFIKAFDKLDAFQERANFSTWLNTIAFNYCSDQLRIAKRLNTTPLNENHELADSREAGLQEETFQSFQQALASLPLKEQTLLRLKYEQGMTVEEIAQIYRLKTSAVKMRLKRSREKLQQLCTVSYAD